MNDVQNTTIHCTICDLLTLQDRGDLGQDLEYILAQLMTAFPDIAGKAYDDFYDEKYDVEEDQD